MQVQITRPDGRTVVIGQPGPVPITDRELRTLEHQRGELRAQIENVGARIAETHEQLNRTHSNEHAPIRARLQELDARKVALEGQLDRINDRIANADVGALTAMTAVPRDPMEHAIADNLVPIVGMLSMFFLFPIAIAFARLLWKRGTGAAARTAVTDPKVVTRLDQLQTSMDAMALEVERISENQRYVTKLLGEKERAALPR